MPFFAPDTTPVTPFDRDASKTPPKTPKTPKTDSKCEKGNQKGGPKGNTCADPASARSAVHVHLGTSSQGGNVDGVTDRGDANLHFMSAFWMYHFGTIEVQHNLIADAVSLVFSLYGYSITNTEEPRVIYSFELAA